MAAVVALFAAVCLTARAQDIQPGFTFQDGQRLTAAQLGQLVSQATILPTFVSGKPTDTGLSPNDLLLVEIGGALYRAAVVNVVFQNTNLFTQNPVAGSVSATNTFLVLEGNSVYQLSAGQLQTNLVIAALTATNLVYKQPAATNLWNTNAFLYQDWDSTGTNAVLKSLSVSNLFSGLPPALSSFTNTDTILVWSMGTNAGHGTLPALRQASLAGLFTNAATSATLPLTNTDVFWFFSWGTNSTWDPGGTNPTVASATLGQVAQYVTNLLTAPRSEFFPTNIFALLSGAGVVTNMPHGLPGRPQVVSCTLSNQTSELGFSVGDEVQSYDLVGGSDQPVISVGANSTNVFVLMQNVTHNIIRKDTGASATITDAKWAIKIYAVYFP